MVKVSILDKLESIDEDTEALNIPLVKVSILNKHLAFFALILCFFS